MGGRAGHRPHGRATERYQRSPGSRSPRAKAIQRPLGRAGRLCCRPRSPLLPNGRVEMPEEPDEELDDVDEPDDPDIVDLESLDEDDDDDLIEDDVDLVEDDVVVDDVDLVEDDVVVPVGVVTDD